MSRTMMVVLALLAVTAFYFLYWRPRHPSAAAPVVKKNVRMPPSSAKVAASYQPLRALSNTTIQGKLG